MQSGHGILNWKIFFFPYSKIKLSFLIQFLEFSSVLLGLPLCWCIFLFIFHFGIYSTFNFFCWNMTVVDKNILTH